MVISKQLFGTKMKTFIIVEFPFPINAMYYIITSIFLLSGYNNGITGNRAVLQIDPRVGFIPDLLDDDSTFANDFLVELLEDCQ